jgi:hypothetical protein
MSIHALVRSLFLAAPLCLAMAGCGAPAPQPGDDVELVPEGKGDNYFSISASEYWVDGTATLVLDAADQAKAPADKLTRARALADLKTVQIGWFLDVRLIDKESGGGDHGDANADTYPGYHAIVRTGDWTLSNLRALDDGMTYAYDVRLQIAGQKNLLSQLPGTTLSGGKKTITLQMGKVSNQDLARLDPEHEWFRDPQWDSGSFDPAKLTADQLEPIDLTLSLQDAGDDAYLDINKLIADGKLTIDAHYGWDYWSRYDISNAQDVYDNLIAQGFASPSKTWEQYRGDLGPLTKTVAIGDKQVTVEVKIFHPSGNGTDGYDPETDAGGIAMEKAMTDSLAASDVIIFFGHSGQYYGFALADWNKTARGALDYPALMAAAMPKDRYQIVLASGCDTFSTGEAFRQNPNKPGLANLNVITTNTFSNEASDAVVRTLLGALYGGGTDHFVPAPISSMLEEMNGIGIGSMFGVHGTDGDPKLHPFATLATLGQSCTQNSDCGGDGNRCTKISSSERVCSATCLGDSACPSGYRCRDVASTGTTSIVGKQCLK